MFALLINVYEDLFIFCRDLQYALAKFVVSFSSVL